MDLRHVALANSFSLALALALASAPLQAQAQAQARVAATLLPKPASGHIERPSDFPSRFVPARHVGV